jgi:hypothetical protein
MRECKIIIKYFQIIEQSATFTNDRINTEPFLYSISRSRVLKFECLKFIRNDKKQNI